MRSQPRATARAWPSPRHRHTKQRPRGIKLGPATRRPGARQGRRHPPRREPSVRVFNPIRLPGARPRVDRENRPSPARTPGPVHERGSVGLPHRISDGAALGLGEVQCVHVERDRCAARTAHMAPFDITDRADAQSRPSELLLRPTLTCAEAGHQAAKLVARTNLDARHAVHASRGLRACEQPGPEDQRSHRLTAGNP